MDSNLPESMEQLSIAQARQNLPALVHKVEKFGACQLTRRGRPVAVLLSQLEYDRLRQEPACSLWDVVSQARQRLVVGLRDKDLEGLRDSSPPRDAAWPD